MEEQERFEQDRNEQLRMSAMDFARQYTMLMVTQFVIIQLF